MVVTRYFGGTLLGTGGLVRAYTDASKEAIKDAESDIYTVCEYAELNFTFDYQNEGKVRRILEDFAISPSGTDYTEKVRFSVSIEEERADALKQSIKEGLSGAVAFDT
jgi:putative IMPACT (imprinted ancient) family translation regulator